MESIISSAKYLIILIGILLRWCTSLHPHSGQNKPPLFGDYEAQRHWMEITTNLPVGEWYHNTTRNDLLYWGLDYPPLTAYHMWLCGVISSIFYPQSVELFSSRGYESYGHKIFMRSTVLISDLLIFFPAMYYYFLVINSSKNNVRGHNQSLLGILIALTFPGLIIVDYGHFQYNCVSLGLMTAAVAAVFKGSYKFACVLFALALNYKQMELYHALPFFFYLLGLIFKKYQKTRSIFGVALSFMTFAAMVLSTFLIVWFPFIFDASQVSQILHRVFPIYRGVFEDKVANFWCFFNVFYKLRAHCSNETIAQICLVTTAAAVLPSCFNLFIKPTLHKFKLSLIIVSLGFFLFSYHVHEKSILLVSVPVILHFLKDPFPCFWFLTVSTLSLSHLVVKDNLIIAFVALTGLFILISLSSMRKFSSINLASKSSSKSSGFLRGSIKKTHLFFLSVVGYFYLFVGLVSIEPPQRYPDIFPLLLAVYSFVHFASFFVYFYSQQFSTAEAKKEQ
nr:PREDICTED: dolichyl pyrophosphate Man9GlcNAc2 alpha-1,3-glucosyltransferase-like isoform X1 [Bemisia tabaci]XP_018909956.1 PREDICTED: dolichyl pyrophosphate Man9GlcNAc2 alpha-1,3-glucosyltransferase-like isoform X1 [Bemisia tabaci]